MPGVTWNSFDMQQPDWAACQLDADKLLPAGTQLDVSQFNFSDSQTVRLAAGVVTAGANRTLNLAAPLTENIPAGAILDFGASEFCTLTLGARAGATSIAGVTVAADLEGGETAVWRGISGHVTVPSGLLVGRTFTERSNGAGFGPAATTDDEIFLVAFQVERAELDAGVTLLRHGTLIYENRLPGWAGMDAATRAVIRSRYHCIVSA